MTHEIDEILHLGEEIANSITHGLGLALAIAGLAVLEVLAVTRGTWLTALSCGIYGATLVLLYLASTLYHSFSFLRVRRLFKKFDHCAIYLLIAGTYTPFVLLCLRSWLGYAVLAVVWAASILGVVIKSIWIDGYGVLSATLYACLGWVGIVTVRPMLQVLPLAALLWIVAGGIAYTLGLIFFGSKWRYAHTVWHLFVLAGSVCHYVAIVRYVVR